MYLGEVKEFGSGAEVARGENTLLFSDSFYIYDNNIKPIYELNRKSFFDEVHVTPCGVWMTLKSEEGAEVSKKINIASGCVEKEEKFRFSSRGLEVAGTSFVVEGRRDKTAITAYDQDSRMLHQIYVPFLMNLMVAYHGNVYVCDNKGSIFCFSQKLTLIWSVNNNKKTFSNNLYLDRPQAFDGLIIVNSGEDKDGARGNFEINAYKSDTGELVWQQILEKSPNSNNLVGEKLYIAVGKQFLQLDAKTGIKELDVVLDCTTFTGEPGEVGVVYPVSEGLLFIYHQSRLLELRSFDARTILQTIELPETYTYHLDTNPAPIVDNDKVYLNLTHLVLGCNLMKTGIAVLTPDATAPSVLAAKLEDRPPHTVTSFKDQKGKNALCLRMGGNDPDKIMRSAHVTLKELALRTGVCDFFTFETRDKKNAGTLELEVDTKELSSVKTQEQWLEYFSVIKNRVENELEIGDIKAGDGKSSYAITVKVV